jgi:hypothetical protein
MHSTQHRVKAEDDGGHPPPSLRGRADGIDGAHQPDHDPERACPCHQLAGRPSGSQSPAVGRGTRGHSVSGTTTRVPPAQDPRQRASAPTGIAYSNTTNQRAGYSTTVHHQHYPTRGTTAQHYCSALLQRTSTTANSSALLSTLDMRRPLVLTLMRGAHYPTACAHPCTVLLIMAHR